MGNTCSVNTTAAVSNPHADSDACPMPHPKHAKQAEGAQGQAQPPSAHASQDSATGSTGPANEGKTASTGKPDASPAEMGPQHNIPPLAEKYRFPGYEPHPVVSNQCIAVCEKSWTLLMSGQTEPLQQLKAADRNSSASIAFYDTFYQYLADKHPDTMLFFKNTNIQSRATSLAKMLSSGFNLAHQHGDKVHEILTNIAGSHVRMLKVTADHYTPVVMALMHTLETLFGSAYTPEISSAWFHLYSLILNVMIPVAEEVTKQTSPAPAPVPAPSSSGAFPEPLSPPLATATSPASPSLLPRNVAAEQPKQASEPAAAPEQPQPSQQEEAAQSNESQEAQTEQAKEETETENKEETKPVEAEVETEAKPEAEENKEEPEESKPEEAASQPEAEAEQPKEQAEETKEQPAEPAAPAAAEEAESQPVQV